MGAKRDRVPENTFLERLFKPSVVWQDDGKYAEINGSGEFIPPSIEPDEGIIEGSTIKETSLAHEVMAVIAPWTEPILTYLLRQELPDDQTEARHIIRRSKAYKVHEGELYKKSTTGVLQRCISEEEGRQLLAEIHAGMGGHTQ
jgi:hypothetical protein